MLPYQQRVVAEKADLDDKIAKLVAFLETSPLDAVDPAERVRLNNQLDAMDRYSEILGERIAHF